MENSKNFIEQFIDEDLAPGGRYEGMTVHTRFPPEPNGYIHIGHAYAMNISFSMADKYGGLYNLRMDDTNPAKEDTEYVEAIKDDIKWLGWDWGDRFYYGSDYFAQTYEFAVHLIKKGLAYVCELTQDEVLSNRGDLTNPAVSPWRDRPIEESLDLFSRMKAGEFPDGALTLRAKIDLASGNFHMRDPVIYRIKHHDHHNTGSQWCVYPMYDFAHPIQDTLEGITHSLCSLEFVPHRPLYEWVAEHIDGPCKPRQIEFGRRSLDHTVVSKRKLRQLVEEGIVDGWDDPRFPTIVGLRRRGYTPAAIRDFYTRIGVGRTTNIIEYALLEHCLREDLNNTAPRAMAVIDPVKLTITNYPSDKTEQFAFDGAAPKSNEAAREISFSRSLWIERSDFSTDPPKKYNRLFIGNEVRLKSAYIVKCTGCNTDENGIVTEVFAEYDPATSGGNTPDGRKVRGTIHWVNAADCFDAEVRLYDKLFTDPEPDAGGKDFMQLLNPNSLVILSGCKAESYLQRAQPGDTFQFLRLGYFNIDSKYSKQGAMVFNRCVSLKDGFKAP